MATTRARRAKRLLWAALAAAGVVLSVFAMTLGGAPAAFFEKVGFTAFLFAISSQIWILPNILISKPGPQSIWGKSRNNSFETNSNHFSEIIWETN